MITSIRGYRDTSSQPANLMLILAFVFFFNPFWGLVLTLCLVPKYDTSKERRVLYFFISLFFGMVAFTQSTTEGDVSRMYEGIIDSYHLYKHNFASIIFAKHIIYDLVNVTIYGITGNVRFVSFLWVFITYFAVFLSFENLKLYYKRDLRKNDLLTIVLAIIFCFIIFSQVTEIMKQGVATALFLYALSCILLHKNVKAIVLLLIAVNIHFSILFFIPFLLVKVMPNALLWILFFLSFSLREFDFLGTLNDAILNMPVLGNIAMLDALYTSVDEFQHDFNDFYKSGSAFFVFIYYALALLTVVIRIIKKESLATSICMVLLIVLNLNYSSDHNYTRMLTMLFPFYLLLYFDIKELKNKQYCKIMMFFLLASTFLVNARMFSVRVIGDAYGTSFLDNSLINLLTYPLIMYFM